MKGFFLIILSWMVTISWAQQEANFIVQSDDSVSFFLEIDGVRQLDTAHFNIKVTGIEEQSHQVRVIIVGEEKVSVEKPLFFQSMDVESTMKLVYLNEEYKLRYFGEVSMGAAPVYENQVIVPCKTSSSKSVSAQPDVSEMTKVEALSYELQNGTNVTTDVTFAPTTSPGDVHPVQVSDSAILDSLSPLLDSNEVYDPELLEVVYSYSGEKGCSFPNFKTEELIDSIKRSDFSSQKIKMAKEGVRNQCMTTAQVEKIAQTLEFEDTKLSFVKFAYSYTYDKQNYKTLLKLFNFSNTRTDFLEFIKS